MTVTPTPVRQRAERSKLLLGLVIGAALASIGAFLLANYGAVRDSSSSATLQGSGHAVSQVRTVPPFTRAELAGSNNVTISVGSRQLVVVRGDDNLVGRVTTRVRAGRLVIGNRPGSVAAKTPMSVTVTVPTLDGFTLSGSGTVTLAGISTGRFTLELPGSGVINASGSATRLETTIAGSGQAGLIGLSAHDVRASISGSGTIMLTALDRLDAVISGSGSIVYQGNPASVTKAVSGSGSIVGG
jgi:hypothetical protein